MPIATAAQFATANGHDFLLGEPDSGSLRIGEALAFVAKRDLVIDSSIDGLLITLRVDYPNQSPNSDFEVAEFRYSNGIVTRLTTKFGSNGTSAVAFSGTVILRGALTHDELQGQRVVVSDQDGLTGYDKFMRALDAASGLDIVIGEPSLTVGLTQTALIPDFVRIDGMGMNVYAQSSMANMFEGIEGGTPSIAHCVINADSKVSANVILGDGVARITVQDTEIYNFSGSAITVQTSASGATVNGVNIIRNKIHTPQLGVGHPVIVKSVVDREFIKNVWFHQNWMLGTDPLNRTVADFSADNQYTGDQAIFQGVEALSILNNYSGWSGSSGFSVSRLCQNVIVRNNIAEMCYEPGFNIGGGFEAVHVEQDLSTYQINDDVVGENSEAQGTVVALLPDSLGTGGWVRMEVTGGWFMQYERLQKSGVPLNTESPVIDILQHAAENVLLDANTAIDTGIQGLEDLDYAAFNLIRSDGVRLYNNRYANPRGLGRVNKLVSASNSKAIVDANEPKYWEHPDQYVAAGPVGEFTHVDEWRGGLKPGKGAEDIVIATVTGGAKITPVTHTHHTIDLEQGISSLNINRIDISNAKDKDVLHLMCKTSMRRPTLLDSAGIRLPSDFTFTSSIDLVVLMYSDFHGSWIAKSTSNNG